jgi:crotonobetainyl-CoA:carnitine CoA-transferase CaiB-like acyl-CoA transferase
VSAPADGLPLAGIRVLDLTSAWAGPMATRLLAALGADVVKIEGPGRIDSWRGAVDGGHPSRYPDGDPGARPYNRNVQFNTQNVNKRSISLDLKSAEGLAVARDLAAESDVVIANFSAGTLDRMGLGWDVMRELNPGLILVEMPAYGRGGPYEKHVALGPSMEFMSGMSYLVGYGDGRPVTTGPAYLDPMGGFNGAAAVLTCLLARRLTGRGQYLELAQREAAMHWIGDEVLRAVRTGEDRPPHGNRSRDTAPHDCFPAAGTRQWVVIDARTDEQFRSLCEIAGLPELAQRYSTLAQRLTAQDEIHTALAEWTRRLDKHVVAHQLQAAGIAAAAVHDGKDLAESEFLWSRGLMSWIDHPDAGRHVYQGLPLHVDGLDLSPRRPAPMFGQHTDEVLHDLLGLDEDELADLRGRGVITDAPRH